MQKIKTVQIGKQSFTIKELPVAVVWELMNKKETALAGDVVGQLQNLLALACPELTTAALLEMYPSEIEELWHGFEEVNAAFLGVVRLIGLDLAIIGAVTVVVKTSIEQFACSLPAVTAPESGTTAMASS